MGRTRHLRQLRQGLALVLPADQPERRGGRRLRLVGLLAAHSAILRGASRVFGVDFHPDRLRLGEQFGADPIDFFAGDPWNRSSRPMAAWSSGA